MADKKRKDTSANPQPPPKKTKRTMSSTADIPPTVASNGVSTTSNNETAVKSKTNRKRAADFLTEEEQRTPNLTSTADASAKSSKKSKKSPSATSVASSTKKSKGSGVSLTADGVNGVVEHSSDSEVEIATGATTAKKSLVAEGLRTADKELADGSDDESDNNQEEPDQGAALLAGFDSDTEDPAEDKDLDPSKTGSIPNYKKTSKKLRQAAEKGSNGPGTVYVGRIPHGFYEKQMREYFSQFGDISRLRLSRNRRTGASKHFAFIEFASDEVAKIVAETMDNYLMFGHILKCKYALAENLHPDVWKGADKKFRKIPHDKLERQQLEAPKTVAQWEKKNRKEQQKRRKNATKLQELGYTIPLPVLKSPAAALELRKEGTAAISDDNVVNGELADDTKASKVIEEPVKKVKGGKKAKVDKSTDALTEGNLGAQNAKHYVQVPKGQDSKKGAAVSTTTSAAVNVPTSGTSERNEDTSATKKSRKRKSSTLGGSNVTDKGDYDALSSIPIGNDAAGDESAQDRLSAGPAGFGSIDTISGVADSVLKQRKKGRKRSKSDKQDNAEAAADVNEIAPMAHQASKKAKKDDKKKKVIKA